ncbi:MAG TPA: heavy metal translocating P-type ATPase [Arenimonas sp.]|nr:heavy metal translocating P-type ATPase [Arenimonas sp.]
MPAETQCFHCDEMLNGADVKFTLNGIPRQFCCLGCAHAAQWIEQEGLGDYYQLRNQQANKVDEQSLDYSAWDREEIQRSHCHDIGMNKQIVLLSNGMQCAACSWLIQKALIKNPGINLVNANAITGRIEIVWDPVKTKLSAICTQLARLGYKPFLSLNEAFEKQKRSERNRLLLKLGIAALVTTQTMMFSEALYLDTQGEMSLATRDFFRWLTFLLCSPVVFYSGSEFIVGMLREIKHRQLGMDTLAASSILLAYFASLYQTLIGGEHIWFDAAAMFVFFLLSARVLERFARHKARAQVDLLARAQPQFAWRIKGDEREQCAISQLKVGDCIYLSPGDSIAADGILLSDGIEVDESLLTGEAELTLKQKGDKLLAGCTLGPNAGTMQVSHTGSDTQLSHILRLVETSQSNQPPEQLWAKRLAGRFVILMFIITGIAYTIWWQIDSSKAFSVALAVLVAACPCALSLAIPAAVSSAFDALARLGVVVLKPEALTKLLTVKHVIFDKTGTLTAGKPSLDHIRTFNEFDSNEALQIAYSMELGLMHPLAQAFKNQNLPCINFESISNIPGHGISAKHNQQTYLLGKADFVAPGQADQGIWLSINGQLMAQFLLSDPIKQGSAQLVRSMQAQSIECHVLSGDSLEKVESLANTLAIPQFRARATPDQKLHYLQILQERGNPVLMVGDGINDAPVLAQADVSMAMGSGAYIAQNSADILLLNSKPEQIQQVFSIARHMRYLMQQNIRWAIGYNLIAIGMALSGIIHPGYASLGMAGSSLLVTLNALRIYRVKS